MSIALHGGKGGGGGGVLRATLQVKGAIQGEFLSKGGGRGGGGAHPLQLDPALMLYYHHAMLLTLPVLPVHYHHAVLYSHYHYVEAHNLSSHV